MAETTRTLFRTSDGVLTAVKQDGQRPVLKNDGSGATYYDLGVAGAQVSVAVDVTVPAILSVLPTPTVQSTEYTVVVTFTEVSGVSAATVTANTGVVHSYDLTARNVLTVVYTTPAAEMDVIHISATDNAGNVATFTLPLPGLTA